MVYYLYQIFRPKGIKNLILWRRTYLCRLHKRFSSIAGTELFFFEVQSHYCEVECIDADEVLAYFSISHKYNAEESR